MPIKFDITLYHHGDWTTYTEDFGELVFESVDAFCNPRHNKNVELMIAYGKRDAINSFIEGLKRENSPVKLMSVHKINSSLNVMCISGSYANSVRSSFFENGCVIKRLIVEKGEEKFSAIVFERSNVDKLLSEISSTAEIIDVQTKFIHPTKIIPNTRVELSPLERRIIGYAFGRGFFEKPRQIDLESLSKVFGLSKSTMDYHIKKCLRKILSTFLESIY